MKNRYFLLLISVVFILLIVVVYFYFKTSSIFFTKRPIFVSYENDVQTRDSGLLPYYNEAKAQFQGIQWTEAVEKEYSEYDYFDVTTQDYEPYDKVMGKEVQIESADYELVSKVVEFFEDRLEKDGWHQNLSADKAGGGYGSSIFGYGKAEEQFIFYEETFCEIDEESGEIVGGCSGSLKVFYGRKQKAR